MLLRLLATAYNAWDWITWNWTRKTIAGVMVLVFAWWLWPSSPSVPRQVASAPTMTYTVAPRRPTTVAPSPTRPVVKPRPADTPTPADIKVLDATMADRRLATERARQYAQTYLDRSGGKGEWLKRVAALSDPDLVPLLQTANIDALPHAAVNVTTLTDSTNLSANAAVLLTDNRTLRLAMAKTPRAGWIVNWISIDPPTRP